MDRRHVRHHSDQYSRASPHHTSPIALRPPFSPNHPGYPPQSRASFGDPFSPTRDPFRSKQNGQNEEGAMRSRAWSNQSQAHRFSPSTLYDHDPSARHQQQPSHAPFLAHKQPFELPNFLIPTAPSQQPLTTFTQPTNAAPNVMSSQFDPARRRSISTAAPTQYSACPPASPSSASTIGQRAMPPPSPQRIPPSASAPPSHHAEPHGPPTTSPFTGIRDLANLSSTRRHNTSMSISSMLGNEDERPGRSAAASPQSVISHPNTSTTRDLMHPPSPARARASSMREGGYNAAHYRERSPPVPSAATIQRDGIFRSFVPADTSVNGHAIPNRPSSQPVDASAPPAPLRKHVSHESESTAMGKLGVFRTFDEAPRFEPSHARQHHNHATDPKLELNHNGRKDDFPHHAATMREDQAALFRPAYPTPQHSQAPSQALDSIESRNVEYRQPASRTTPPPSYPTQYRNGQHDRPLTYEEHQRMDTLSREEHLRREELLQRKDSNGSVARFIFNVSPDLNRRGRDSPLPQAVQGAAPRHVGPSDDRPSIKSEFGRMFSGLGSGVGSATPVAGQSMNGTTTPSRLASPPRYADEDAVDLVRSASVGGIKSGFRRPREEAERDGEVYDGRLTPSLSRGIKRVKSAHPPPPHHHHHHHHHSHRHHHDAATERPDAGSYSMIRFASNPPPQAGQPAHRHFHYHGNGHVHNQHHHHHHAPRSAPAAKLPTITVKTQGVLDAVASKPRKHLGSMPYRADVSVPPLKADSDYRRVYSAQADLMPRFDGRENCLFTIRVPRWYITRSKQDVIAGDLNPLEGICRDREVWGTEIYTDDSDIIAAAVHAGWIRGDWGEFNSDLREIDGDPQSGEDDVAPQLCLTEKPSRPARIPPNRDMHITVLILPALQAYASAHQHHLLSRDWSSVQHDGMSYMIHKVEFVNEGAADRGFGRDAKSRKARLAAQEAERRRAAASALLMLPDFGSSTLLDRGATGIAHVTT